MVYKQVVQKVIDLLKADASLLEPTVVKKYYFGAPLKPIDYPFIYVQWDGQRPVGPGESDRFLYQITFEIGVVDRSVNEDDAEKSVYDKVEAVKDVLKTYPTLQGLVTNDFEPFEVNVVRAEQKDYALAYAQILYPRRLWLDAF